MCVVFSSGYTGRLGEAELYSRACRGVGPARGVAPSPIIYNTIPHVRGVAWAVRGVGPARGVAPSLMIYHTIPHVRGVARAARGVGPANGVAPSFMIYRQSQPYPGLNTYYYIIRG